MVDLRADLVVFETSKKRRSGVYRAVPVSHALVDMLDLVHGLRPLQGRSDRGRHHRLWSWSRMTGWRRVCEVMARATVRGPQASPKGLRHGFGVAAVTAGVPLNLVQKWLGHAQLSTTAIYADAVGEEEHAIAARFRGARAHDYEWLLVLYAEQGGARLLASVVPHFVRVNSWSTDMRYTPGTVAVHEAQAFVEAAITIMTWADGRL